MSLKVAVQMDPIANVDTNADSTFVLALEAQARGHALWHYPASALTYDRGHIVATAEPMVVRREKGNHFTLGASETIDLAEMDVVLMRQDPPFDMAYITATHLLEHIHPQTLVVNDPGEVRNAPEKLFVTLFRDLMPPTMITADADRIRAFRDAHHDIIVKPLYGNGGAGVFHIRPGDENLNSLLETFASMFREPVIAQAYVPEIRQGDKRIILVDGEAKGVLNRIPATGEARSNMHVGGTPLKATMSARDAEICARLGPELRKRGLLFAGIDVIGDWLTEINVTSPTGLQEIARFDGIHLEVDLWNAIEDRVG